MPETSSKPVFGPWAGKAALVVGASLLCLLAAEAISRLAVDSIPQLDLDIYRKSSDGQLLLRPRVTRQHSTRHWNVTVSINEEGWRDRPGLGSTQDSFVLGLGDSLAFGWGVELEESMFFLLERGQRKQGPVRLLKAAVPGTGPGDQLWLLQTMWQTPGQNLEAKRPPSVVILVFFVGNDFVDVQMGGARQFQVEDGLLVRENFADEAPPALQALRMKTIRNSRLLQLLMGTWWQWSHPDSEGGPDAVHAPRRWDEWLREFAQIHLREYPPQTSKAVAQTLDLLTEMHQACRTLAADFLLVVVPRGYQVYENETEELRTSLGLSDDDLDLDKPQRILTEWAEHSGVRVADLLGPFREHHRTHPKQRLFYYPDAHLNRLGHRLAAAAIQPLLSQLIENRMQAKTPSLDASAGPQVP